MRRTESNNPIDTTVLVFVSLCIVLNLVGGEIALLARLPVYVDTIGTITSAILLGPVYGMVTGALTSAIFGALFDPVDFFYMPVAVTVGGLTGLFFRNHRFEGLRSVVAIVVISMAGSFIGSLITAFVFSGVTSSGSSYIVAGLRSLGASLFSSVFVTQLFTDLLDRVVSFAIAFFIISRLPKTYIRKLTKT